MVSIHKKLIVDEQGHPTEVIIPWMEFLEIAELLGMDLDEAAIDDLEQARADRMAGNQEAYLSLDEI